jgi:RNAse (barnase) inhibitor barstar
VDNSGDNLEERLLQNGCVVLYFNPFVMEAHSSQLVASGWEFREIYIAQEGTWNEFCDSVSIALEFPEYFGRNLNALRDCLCDIAAPANGKLAIGLECFDLLAHNEPDKAQAVLDIFAEMERGYLMRGGRILFLIQSNDPDLRFEAVGGQPVLWNFEEWLDSKRKLKPE